MTDTEECIIAREDEIPEGERIIVQVEGREIAVFNINGEVFAYTNWCLHQGGPICEGALTGTSKETFDRETLTNEFSWGREGEILNCPWHGWEYDVRTGECLSRSNRDLHSYPVTVKDGDVVISL